MGKKKGSDAKADSTNKPPKPLAPTVVIYVISGGLDICSLTYSTAKRIAKTSTSDPAVPEEPRDPLEKKLEAMAITFDDDDINNITKEHEDSLVISLMVGNCLLKRVLVDGGSSANVLSGRPWKKWG